MQQQQPSAPQPTTAFVELHTTGFTVLRGAFTSRRCKQLRAAAARENYSSKAIFNGQASGEAPQRFAARSDSWAGSAERDLERELDRHGVLPRGGHGGGSATVNAL